MISVIDFRLNVFQLLKIKSHSWYNQKMYEYCYVTRYWRIWRWKIGQMDANLATVRSTFGKSDSICQNLKVSNNFAEIFTLWMICHWNESTRHKNWWKIVFAGKKKPKREMISGTPPKAKVEMVARKMIAIHIFLLRMSNLHG